MILYIQESLWAVRDSFIRPLTHYTYRKERGLGDWFGEQLLGCKEDKSTQSRQNEGDCWKDTETLPESKGRKQSRASQKTDIIGQFYLLSPWSGGCTGTLSSCVSFLFSRGRTTCSANCTSKYKHT